MKWMMNTVAILGALAVILGAFGAHGLKDMLTEERLNAYQTGVTYHFYHTIALLILAVWYRFQPQKVIKRSMIFFIIGIILFSGSLYILATQSIMNVSMKWLGPVTPIGGLFFILGWGNLLFTTKDNN